MAKTKKEQQIYVIKPKVGERYHFRFAGSPMFGPIESLNESLTNIDLLGFLITTIGVYIATRD